MENAKSTGEFLMAHLKKGKMSGKGPMIGFEVDGDQRPA
jgi:hypothetical protein